MPPPSSSSSVPGFTTTARTCPGPNAKVSVTKERSRQEMCRERRDKAGAEQAQHRVSGSDSEQTLISYSCAHCSPLNTAVRVPSSLVTTLPDGVFGPPEAEDEAERDTSETESVPVERMVWE
eukprot:3093161-Rhodomonas_salina.1